MTDLESKAVSLSDQAWAFARTSMADIGRIADNGPLLGDDVLIQATFWLVLGELNLRGYQSKNPPREEVGDGRETER